MDFTPEKRKKTAKWLIGVVTACILIFLGVQNIGAVADALSWCISLIAPLLIGFAIAVILNVPMGFFESHFWKNTKKPHSSEIAKTGIFFAGSYHYTRGFCRRCLARNSGIIQRA